MNTQIKQYLEKLSKNSFANLPWHYVSIKKGMVIEYRKAIENHKFGAVSYNEQTDNVTQPDWGKGKEKILGPKDQFFYGKDFNSKKCAWLNCSGKISPNPIRKFCKSLIKSSNQENDLGAEIAPDEPLANAECDLRALDAEYRRESAFVKKYPNKDLEVKFKTLYIKEAASYRKQVLADCSN